MFTYLALNIFTLVVPLIRSFEPRIRYVQYFKPLFSAIGITAFVFLFWDYFFTKIGVWEFSHDHVIGVYLFGMPIEEWMFFFSIPFACIFIYEVFSHLSDASRYLKISLILSTVLGIGLLIAGYLHIDKLYTSITFMGTGLFLLFVSFQKFIHLPNFFIAYFISLLPFFLVNGILTSVPVVTYNDAENLGIRLFSIPIEDSVYMLLLLLMNVFIYEKLKLKWAK